MDRDDRRRAGAAVEADRASDHASATMKFARPNGRAPSPHGARVGARVLAVVVLTAMFLAIPVAHAVGAAAVTAQWTAQVGSAGANGAATIKVLSTKVGTIALSLKGLARATTYSAAIHTGTCVRPSTTKLLALVNLRTTSTGTFARTSSLTASQAAKINRTGMIIRFVAGTRVACGAFKAVALPPPPPAIAKTVKVGSYPQGVALTPLGVFVTNWYDETLSRVDPASNSVLSTILLAIGGNAGPQAIAYGEGALWVAVSAFDEAGENAIPGQVLRIDPNSGQVGATIPIGKGGYDIVTSPGAVWVTNYDDNTVTRIDTATNQAVIAIPVGSGPFGIAFGFGSIWVANEDSGTVSRIDPATNQVAATIQTVEGPEGITIGAGAVWVANWGHTGVADGVITRIDPVLNSVTRTIPVGKNPGFVSFGGGSVWVALQGEPTVVRVNPATNTVQHRVSIAPPELDADGDVIAFWGIAATDHAVWVTKPRDGTAETAPPAGDVVRINF